MKAYKSVWKIMIGLTAALSACGEAADASESELVGERSSALQDGGGVPLGASAVVGDVIANNGYRYAVGYTYALYLDSANWDSCPTGYSYVGHRLAPDGFWLCARSDLANRTFYLGDVEANQGNYYRVSAGVVTTLASQYWDTCTDGSSFIGRWFNSNGFWLCIK
jgi:hypothetical protein